MQKYFPLFFAFVLWTIPAIAQQHEASEDYVYPTDTAVVKNLKKWQDRKFGLFMHWGTYSQWGIVESWSLCPEDEPWTQRKGPYSKDYFTYKKAYENLQTTFNPTKFNPEKWVNAAKNAGLLAAQILGTSDERVTARLKAYKEDLKQKVEATAKELEG